MPGSRASCHGLASGKISREGITIDFPPVSAADDGALVSAITELINIVYAEAELGIWRSGFQRTSKAEIATLIRNGQLALAVYNTSETSSISTLSLPVETQPIGCIFINYLSAKLGTFGMLALDPAHRGSGVGHDLVAFAEDDCRQKGCSAMQLELLVPLSFEHAFKTRLQTWYTRLGYQLVKLGSFEKEYPELAPLLAGPAEYRVFEKEMNEMT